MADLGEVKNVSGVFGGVELENMGSEGQQPLENAGTIRQAGSNLPTKVGFWNKFKAFVTVLLHFSISAMIWS